MISKLPKNGFIVFYDGHCPLCHWSVRSLIKRDVKGQFYFASLQGSLGKQFVAERQLEHVDALLLWKPQHAFWVASEAVFQIIKRLNGGVKLFWIFSFLPRILTDALYRWIAQNRYRYWKPYTDCPLPAPEIKNRFLD